MNKRIVKYYLLTLFFLFIGGIILSLVLSMGDTYLMILMFVGTGLALVAGAIINLFYFFPQVSTEVKFITPGIISVLCVLVGFLSSPLEMVLFSFYALANLILGLIWNYRIKSERNGDVF